MANARGVVTAEVCGKSRRLRLSLEAIDEIEVAVGQPFAAVAVSLSSEQTVRFGHILTMFTALCAAGGTPLTDEERSGLLPSDIPEIVEAVTDACVAAGAIERGGVQPKKKASRPRRSPPGASGKK